MTLAATPIDRFPDCLAFLWMKQNDGQPYHTTPGDRGGGTAWGVTERNWASWREDNHGMNLPDLAHATLDQLKPLIRANYFKAAGADLLPAGLDLALVDFGFNSGVHTAAMKLQALVGAHVDGNIGQETKKAVAKLDAEKLINALGAARLTYLQQIKDPGGWQQFGHGWSNRTNACTIAAQAMRSRFAPRPLTGGYTSA